MLVSVLVVTLLAMFGLGGGGAVAPLLERARKEVSVVVTDEARAKEVERGLERAAREAKRANEAELEVGKKLVELLEDYGSKPEDFAKALASVDHKGLSATRATALALRDTRRQLSAEQWTKLVRRAALEELGTCGKGIGVESSAPSQTKMRAK